MKKVLLYLFFCVHLIPSYSQLGADDETITVKTEYETTNFYSSYYRGDQNYSPITSYRGNVYFVYLDSTLRPILGKIDNTGNTTTEFLDKNTDDIYRAVANDGHHRFSIGIDKKGYIHIVGDVHNYGAEAAINYVDRYKSISADNPDGNHNMYWVSEEPEDITAFEFRGGDIEKVMPGNGFTYPSFSSDMNGDLYVRHRARVSSRGHYNGEMGWFAAKYNADTETWIELGGKAPSDGFPNNYETSYKSIFWEDNGVPAGWWHAQEGRNWYQGFHGDLMRFDFNNRWHLVAAINNSEDQDYNMSDIIYAYSDDGGKTFNKANGAPISELPIRVEEGPNQGSIVARESESLGGYWAAPSVCADKESIPLVTYTRTTTEIDDDNDVSVTYSLGSYKSWDIKKNSWTEEKENPVQGLIRHTNVLDANGIVTYIGPDLNGWIIRTFGVTPSVNTTDITWLKGFFSGIDHRGIREKNVIRGFHFDPDADVKTLKIITVQGTPKTFRPISEEWRTTSLGDISSEESDMYHDIYQLKSTGTFDENLSGQYLNQTIKGDFELEARIINVNYITDSSFAGLMIQNKENDNTAFFGVASTSYQGVKTISKNELGELKKAEENDYEPSEWLKIRRIGNSLTSYRSDNGTNWIVLDSTEIDMEESVSYGLISGSGNSTDIGHSRVDHLSLKDLNVLSLGKSSENNLALDVFPNPTEDDLIHVELKSSSSLSLKVINSLGVYQDVLIEKKNNNMYNITIDKLPSGIYYIIGNDGTVQSTQRFLIK